MIVVCLGLVQGNALMITLLKSSSWEASYLFTTGNSKDVFFHSRSEKNICYYFTCVVQSHSVYSRI